MPKDGNMIQNETALALKSHLTRIRNAFKANPAPTANERIDRLKRLHNAILDYKDRLIAAVDQDFNGRAEAETLIAEILPILEGIHYNQKNLRSWMRQSKRSAPLMLFGSDIKVHYQPLGVVGIVVPWNFPIFLGISPLAGAFAAGNRAMIKGSEFAPRTGEVIQAMLAEYFSEDEVVFVNGDVDVATEFTKLPFDHLVFTGSTQVGKIVMKAAAENLTPVTLELGGKSPAIIHDSFPIEEAANRIAFGKGLNAGQVCVSPDYILVPRAKLDAFASAFAKEISSSYPTYVMNSDYTSIITERQRDRLLDNIRDAKDKGAEIVEINKGQETFDTGRKLPMTLIKNVTEDMRVMQEEIFGPLLPLIPYDTLDEAIAFVNDRDRPLALYYFDWDKARAEKVIRETHSGGVCINEVMTHTMVDDMPFGGVGPSGMGHYHGHEGFLNFSKAKGIVRKGKFNATSMIAAPWGNRMYDLYMKFQFKRFRKHK
ncbi:coniferyl aldehyde dehydrogenase [Kordiimonas sp. SCSIO 12610]|uniref:coniferyl aldehyde dehydrogenase n=1 Tax=Kordiimonas sp. SCSIO 12610 TaxID=2829597 RepID=UPI002108B51F|nr:coniferyl aldehyde dehydrogenase [Kordiimonas sp. SCSIO 12610]UTW56501.1 coniferyl aldehyde dehydrogenase [Kordiimonas sp. SCSIO 12610]